MGASREDKKGLEPDHVGVDPGPVEGWEHGSQMPSKDRASLQGPSGAASSCSGISVSAGLFMVPRAAPANQGPVSVL